MGKFSENYPTIESASEQHEAKRGNLFFLWSPPRSISTAFARMMIERGDHLVIHEPFSSIEVQGYVTIGQDKVTDHHVLLELLQELSAHHRVFVKETTEYRYCIADSPRLAAAGSHALIIRDPRAVIPSHYARNNRVSRDEIGFEHAFQIFCSVYNQIGTSPLVFQAEQLLANPDVTVANYCRYAGIPFIESALTWEAGHRREWSRTSEWHVDAAESRGFDRPARVYAENVDNNQTLAEYYEYHLPFYEHLRSFA